MASKRISKVVYVSLCPRYASRYGLRDGVWWHRFVDDFPQCLAISHAVVFVAHNEVVPLWPESLEGVDAVAVDVGTEATTHATCSPCTFLIDVGQRKLSISDVLPHVVIGPDGQWHTSWMVLA